MSADGDGDAGPGSREVAYRPFAAEFDDASLSYSESDEERAPNYVVTPTGLRVNRLFAVGVLTEVEAINDETLRGRIVDPTGAFVTYAGQYQPEAQAFLDRTTPPAFVAITGKARTFEPEDSDRVFTSVRPESLSEVDADTRDRWVVSAAESTLHRIAVCAAARDSGLRGETLQDALSEAGVDISLATGIPRALDHYETTTAYLEGLRQLAVETLELVADERDEVSALDLAPGDGGDADLGPLPEVDLDLSGAAPPADEADPADQEPAPADEPETATEADESAPTEPASTAGPASADGTAGESADSPGEPTAETADVTGSAADTAESAEPDTTATNGAADATADADTDAAADAAETVNETDTADQDAAEDPGMYQLDEEEREELESEYGSEFSTGNEVDPAGEADIDVPDADELAEQAEAEEAATDTMGNGTTAKPTADDEGGLGEFDDGVGDFQDTSDTTATDTASGEESTAAATDSETTESTPDTEQAEAPTDADATAEPSDAEADATADTTEETASDSQASTDEPAAEDIDLEDTVVETMAEMDDGDGVGREELVAHVTDTYGVEETAVEEAIADALMGGRCYEPGDDQLKAI